MKLRKWCCDLLIVIGLLAVLIASGECENDLLFFIKGIVCISIFTINGLILIKYGNI